MRVRLPDLWDKAIDAEAARGECQVDRRHPPRRRSAPARPVYGPVPEILGGTVAARSASEAAAAHGRRWPPHCGTIPRVRRAAHRSPPGRAEARSSKCPADGPWQPPRASHPRQKAAGTNGPGRVWEETLPSALPRQRGPRRQQRDWRGAALDVLRRSGYGCRAAVCQAAALVRERCGAARCAMVMTVDPRLRSRTAHHLA